MFLFQFVKHIIETVIEIYEILIWWVDPQYTWSQGIGSPIWGSSMTRVIDGLVFKGRVLFSGKSVLAIPWPNKPFTRWVICIISP